MAHYLFNLVPGDRDTAAAALHSRTWRVANDERHRAALAPGDLALVYLGAPTLAFAGRAELASAVDAAGLVRLTNIAEWDPPVPIREVLSRIDSDQAKAEFEAGVVLITQGEFETATVVAAERSS